MALSAGLRIHSAEEDYIGVAQDCVVQLTQIADSGMGPGALTVASDDAMAIDDAGVPAPPMTTAQRVQVTIADCLACSGCITSAEGVLVSSQTKDAFLAALKEGAKTVLVSVSPQTVYSFAVRLGISTVAVRAKIASFLRLLGVAHVFDTSISRDFVWREMCEELLERLAPSPAGEFVGPLPLIVAACPGWVCYAEKKHGEVVLPLMSAVKSPQQAMGHWLKEHVARRNGVDWKLEDLLHVTVMPCYDKKLEAAREDFGLGDQAGSVEVDQVLTSGELLEITQEFPKEWADASDVPALPAQAAGDGSIRTPAAQELESALEDAVCTGGQYVAAGTSGGSGGFAEFCAAFLAGRCGVDLQPEDVTLKAERNADALSTELEFPGLARPLKFARLNGFRNIQNLMRKLQRGACPYDFIEVMACPRGCLNGGGQVAPEPPRTGDEVLAAVQAAERSAPRKFAKQVLLDELWSEWLGASPGPHLALRTQYHVREMPKRPAHTIAW